MSFICMRTKVHFHINGCALSLALKNKLEATLNWPIPAPSIDNVIMKSHMSYSVFIFIFRRYQVLVYPLYKKIPSDATSCRVILKHCKLKNWLIGRTKVFLKYYHVEELAHRLEMYRRKIVILQKGMCYEPFDQLI